MFLEGYFYYKGISSVLQRSNIVILCLCLVSWNRRVCRSWSLWLDVAYCGGPGPAVRRAPLASTFIAVCQCFKRTQKWRVFSHQGKGYECILQYHSYPDFWECHFFCWFISRITKGSSNKDAGANFWWWEELNIWFCFFIERWQNVSSHLVTA